MSKITNLKQGDPVFSEFQNTRSLSEYFFKLAFWGQFYRLNSPFFDIQGPQGM